MLKLILLISCSFSVPARAPWFGQPQPDDWWHDMDTGSVWGTSRNLARNNLYYNTYRQISGQMNTYAPAQHFGKINRGKFLNPELNTPRDRAYGFQSDFNPRDHKSGAFNLKPQGQKFRATEVHVNEGLARYVGEVATMPIGQHVQEDGSILIQTNGWRSPCDPNPCRSVRMPTCTVVNGVTAKCSRAQDYKLTLSYQAPPGSSYNSMFLILVPAFHNGSQPLGCSRSGHVDSSGLDAWIYAREDQGCGVIPDPDYYDYAYEDHVPNRGDKTHILTTLDDGSKYQDYTFQVIAEYNNDYIDEGSPQLTVELGGEVKQVLSVPQDDGIVDVDSNDEVWYYFFGCFRPQLGIVDTRGAGFYYYEVDNTNGLRIYFDYNLCKALLDWPGTPGYNY